VDLSKAYVFATLDVFAFPNTDNLPRRQTCRLQQCLHHKELHRTHI